MKTSDDPEQHPAVGSEMRMHQHTVVKIHGVWEEAGGLFAITRRVCLECMQILQEDMVGLPERRRATRAPR